MKNEITECCPYCGAENTLMWEEKDGFCIICSSCGKKIGLCSVCPRMEENKCNWNEKTKSCSFVKRN